MSFIYQISEGVRVTQSPLVTMPPSFFYKVIGTGETFIGHKGIAEDDYLEWKAKKAMQRKEKKTVRFFPWVEIQLVPFEERRGTWAQDGKRFRKRIESVGRILEPVLTKRLMDNNVNESCIVV